jgi:hypothetical protein
MVGGCCIYHTVLRAFIGSFLDERLAFAYKIRFTLWRFELFLRHEPCLVLSGIPRSHQVSHSPFSTANASKHINYY